MKLLAPAKINLHLRVGPRGNDGFHPLQSWMCTVGLFDTIKIDRRSNASGALVELKCDDASVPSDSRNLVVRAAEALARKFDSDGEAESTSRRASIAPVAIELTKKIPAGGGLGGGSSDAASTLLALSKLWKLEISRAAILTIAVQLGSDVPFFLSGASSICTGRGEIIQPIAPPNAKWCLLILPKIASSTPAVYGRFDEMSVKPSNLNDAIESWPSLSASELLPRLVNDLEAPAFDLHRELRQLHANAERLLSRPVRMSGSGSSLFTLFDDRASADVAGREMNEKSGVNSIVCELSPKFADDLPNA